jgi:two-component system nitrate/nitrite response regulator NarL
VVEASLLPATSARLGDAVRARALREALTNRERQCLDLIVQGKDTSAMSRELHVSRTTVRSHVQALLTKLGVHSRLEAAALAARLGVLSGVAAGPHEATTRATLRGETRRPRELRGPLNG